MSRDRGQTELIGLVLLIGMVATASVGIFLVAGQTVDDVETDSEVERVESGFQELRADVATAGSSDDVSTSSDLSLEDYRDDIRYEDSGNLTVTVNGTDVYASSLGSLEYTANDGTRLVYQAGGIWREDDSGAVPVSTPDVHVRDNSIGLPVPVLGASEDLSGDSVSMQPTGTEQLHSSLVDENVTINVTTQYHEWWADHFESELGSSRVDVHDTGDPDEKTVSVTIDGVDPSSSTEFEIERGLSVRNHYDSGSGASGPRVKSDVAASEITCGSNSSTYNGTEDEVDCDTRFDGDHNATLTDMSGIDSVDSIIEKMSKLKYDREFGDETVGASDSINLTKGHYYAEEIHLNGNLSVDLSDGDVSLVIEDKLEGSNPPSSEGIVVENVTDDHTFTIYNRGNLDMDGQWNACADGCDGKNTRAIQYYGMNGTDVSIGTDQVQFEGVVVAPESDVTFDGSNFTGGLIANNVEMKSPQTNFEFDENLKGFSPDGFPETTISNNQYYLNVAVTEVEAADG